MPVGAPSTAQQNRSAAIVLASYRGVRAGARAGRKVLVRVVGAGGTHDLLGWLERQRLSYSVGFTLSSHTPELLEKIPEQVWTPAYDAHDQIRDGAWVAELIGLLDLTGWPKGMRVIAGKERPHPGAQLRITDIDGLRVTAFATNTRVGHLADREGPATLARHGRQRLLRLASKSPWAQLALTAITRLRLLIPAPG